MRDTKVERGRNKKAAEQKTYKINTYAHRHNTVGAESTQEQDFLYGIVAIRI